MNDILLFANIYLICLIIKDKFIEIIDDYKYNKRQAEYKKNKEIDYFFCNYCYNFYYPHFMILENGTYKNICVGCHLQKGWKPCG